ncbi:hypothetical protein LQZ18_13960 [Lachnospiraceae bacterium ZAX-1]
MKYHEWKEKFVDSGGKRGTIGLGEGDILSQRKAYKNNPIEIMNVNVGDIGLNVSQTYKENILRACNECSVMGQLNNREYLTILNENNAELLSRFKLLEDDENNIKLRDSVGVLDIIKNSTKNLLSLVHNHTNSTMFSLNDIQTF